jgi:hypothetical protein
MAPYVTEMHHTETVIYGWLVEAGYYIASAAAAVHAVRKAKSAFCS